jgi:hypothetical protein
MWFWGASPSEKLFDFLSSSHSSDAFLAKPTKATCTPRLLHQQAQAASCFLILLFLCFSSLLQLGQLSSSSF